VAVLTKQQIYSAITNSAATTAPLKCSKPIYSLLIFVLFVLFILFAMTLAKLMLFAIQVGQVYMGSRPVWSVGGQNPNDITVPWLSG